jgi:hypothetical protein
VTALGFNQTVASVIAFAVCNATKSEIIVQIMSAIAGMSFLFITLIPPLDLEIYVIAPHTRRSRREET